MSRTEPIGEIYVCPHCGYDTDIRVGVVPEPGMLILIDGDTDKVLTFPKMLREEAIGVASSWRYGGGELHNLSVGIEEADEELRAAVVNLVIQGVPDEKD